MTHPNQQRDRLSPLGLTITAGIARTLTHHGAEPTCYLWAGAAAVAIALERAGLLHQITEPILDGTQPMCY